MTGEYLRKRQDGYYDEDGKRQLYADIVSLPIYEDQAKGTDSISAVPMKTVPPPKYSEKQVNSRKAIVSEESQMERG